MSACATQAVTYYSWEYPVPNPHLDEAQRALVKFIVACGDFTMDMLLLRFCVGASSSTSWVQDVMSPSDVRPGCSFLPVVGLFTSAGTLTAEPVPVAAQRMAVKAALRACSTVKSLDWTAHGGG